MTNVDRIVIKAELERLTKANGGSLTPADVVTAATPHNSPLHTWFEWDDTEAAHRFRLDQARHMIKVISVAIQYAPNATVIVPVYVSESTDDEADPGSRRYVQVVEVMGDDQRRHEHVIATANRAISILRNCPEPFCQKWARKLEAEVSKL